MQRTPVSSSAIASAGYDAETKHAHIEFNSGKTYEYPDVEPHEYEALVNAPSIGAHFGKHWRSRPNRLLS